MKILKPNATCVLICPVSDKETPRKLQVVDTMFDSPTEF